MGQNTKPNPDTENTPGALVSMVSPEFTPKLKCEGNQKTKLSLVCTPVTPVLRRQEDQKFKGILGYVMISNPV